jgi:hypothetical protein
MVVSFLLAPLERRVAMKAQLVFLILDLLLFFAYLIASIRGFFSKNIGKR